MELPCNGDGDCMVCKIHPHDAEVLLCNSCSSPWHMKCLRPPLQSVPEGDWQCPDCCLDGFMPPPQAPKEDDIVRKIIAINADASLSEAEKAKKRQQLMSGSLSKVLETQVRAEEDAWNCLYCLKPLDRPVTAPCGHNFCLKCLETAFRKSQKSCPKCRAVFGKGFMPRINAALVMAIRRAKAPATTGIPSSKSVYIQNENRPDKAFLTERAKKAGLANAASGKLFVDVPRDYFGPILKEHDTKCARGVPVGETFANRMECRQWGIHLPHVAGIAGQADSGAQSVVLSGGYVDDEDHGEWFLYTGSGGRDLSGNKRTNKEQSSDQEFTSYNEALRKSCQMGYPVRVVRSHKEVRSSYAPTEEVVRYDGIYRIEKCWRKVGIQGHKVCRYLFVRCDNEPAPWTSHTEGDRPSPMPEPEELNSAIDITLRRGSPHWGWKEEENAWGWLKPPPVSKVCSSKATTTTRNCLSAEKKLKRDFACSICKNVLQCPISTPCAHNFCQCCLLGAFSGQKDTRKRGGFRALRTQKAVKPCPRCKMDISDFMLDPKVNKDMDEMIQKLKKDIEVAGRETNQEPAVEDPLDECDNKGNEVVGALTTSSDLELGKELNIAVVADKHSDAGSAVSDEVLMDMEPVDREPAKNPSDENKKNKEKSPIASPKMVQPAEAEVRVGRTTAKRKKSEKEQVLMDMEPAKSPSDKNKKNKDKSPTTNSKTEQAADTEARVGRTTANGKKSEKEQEVLMDMEPDREPARNPSDKNKKNKDKSSQKMEQPAEAEVRVGRATGKRKKYEQAESTLLDGKPTKEGHNKGKDETTDKVKPEEQPAEAELAFGKRALKRKRTGEEKRSLDSKAEALVEPVEVENFLSNEEKNDDDEKSVTTVRKKIRATKRAPEVRFGKTRASKQAMFVELTRKRGKAKEDFSSWEQSEVIVID